jgi:hypothetical protein
MQDVNFENKILCGDFNCVIDNEADIINGEYHSLNTIEKFNNIVHCNDLVDTWRSFHPESKEFTWSKKNPFVARRLDYIFSSSCLFDKIIEATIVSVSMSDHRGCLIKIHLNDVVHGPGYWKFNNSLLEDTKFVTEMNELIANSTIIVEDDPVMQWELLKIKIKDFSTSYSKLKCNEQRNRSIRLNNELNELDVKLSADPSCVETQQKRENVKLQLEIMEQHAAHSAQIRARVKWIENGEKNTKFFLNLEKSRANSKILTSVKDETGRTVTKQEEILQVQKNYFKNLYRKRIKPDDMQDRIEVFLNNVNVPKLSQEQKNDCEGKITTDEILKALKELKNGSSPGNDGITIEFIKMFWNYLHKLLTASFNHSFSTGNLSITQNKAVIVLIHKGKDLQRCELNNWRPISLTNSDYKLLAKCLALRLSRVVRDIVNSDQVGYIKGRRVSSLLRLVDDVTDQLNVLDKPGILLAVDYTKAFDSISKDFMVSAFEKFGFGPDFLRWINILMFDSKSCISYCGWLSEYFEVRSGVRQGCPFSPLAFVVALEILAIKIRNTSNVKGIRYWENTLKIALYADDITLFF